MNEDSEFVMAMLVIAFAAATLVAGLLYVNAASACLSRASDLRRDWSALSARWRGLRRKPYCPATPNGCTTLPRWRLAGHVRLALRPNGAL
jgi:hypothetical protein